MQIRRFRCAYCLVTIVLEFSTEGTFDMFKGLFQCPLCSRESVTELDPSSVPEPVDSIYAEGWKKCKCGKLYNEHPYYKGAVDHENRPFLHVLCDGTRVKL
jgi:hypothetical protein